MYILLNETKITIEQESHDPNTLKLYMDQEEKEMQDIYDMFNDGNLSSITLYQDDGSMASVFAGYTVIDGFAYLPSIGQLCITLTKIQVDDVKQSMEELNTKLDNLQQNYTLQLMELDSMQQDFTEIKDGDLTMQSNYALQVLAMSFTDEQALHCVLLFGEFDPNGKQYKQGDRFRYNDKFWKVLQDHTSQENWLPGEASSLYVEISDPAIEWPEWKQPTGAHDAYNTGDKVTHNGGKHYISQIDANTTEPGTDERWWKLVDDSTE